MGSGASSDVSAKLEAATATELAEQLASLDPESRSKIEAALANVQNKGSTFDTAITNLSEENRARVAVSLGSDDIAGELSKLSSADRAAKVKSLGGASCEDWVDITSCATDDEIHAPRYYKDYSEFEAKVQAMQGEFGLKMFLTKELYDKYKEDKTKLGVTFDKCIKGGIDTVNLGMDKWNAGKVGLLFGDAECVTKFAEVIDPIMKWRHGDPKLPHPPSNFDSSKLLDYTQIDEKYVISTRVRTGRSIDGITLSPCISATERKKLEAMVVPALLKLGEGLKGDYYPLSGSTTFEAKPTGIDKDTEKRLIDEHFLFQEPHDEPMLLSWRMDRNWPHARGIFHNDAKNALVWVNEEDHLRIISMEKGPNIRAVFDRFAALVKAVEDACKKEGMGFIVDKNYGNICGCPSNCGTGLRASMMVKVPLSSQQPEFKQFCADRRIQPRMSGGFASKTDDGIRDISNCDRMGKDEIELVNEMIKGIIDVIKWEKELEAKQA